MAAEVWMAVALAAVAAAAGVLAWALTLRRRLAGRRPPPAGPAPAEPAPPPPGRPRLDELGAFAHALNGILTPIVGRAQLLRQRLTDADLREWAGAIEQAAVDGASLVQRAQALVLRRRAERAEPVDLAAAVRAALAAVAAPLAARARVEFDGREVPPVDADPVSLQEALGHLIANALEAAPAGRPVRVATGLEDGEAVVSVTDGGPGIPAEIRERIFEPFFTTKPEGAGLGLFVARSVVSRFGGRLEVRSAPGQGTTVRVAFPVAAAAAPAPAPPVPAGRLRCLVVDDDPQVREVIRDILCDAGHEVVVAVDGADGVERFRAESFDLVLTDFAMPKRNGLQLARFCKMLRPTTPVVMLTGWGMLLKEEELVEHGVDEVVSKPVRMDQILKVVATARVRPGAGAGKGTEP